MLERNGKIGTLHISKLDLVDEEEPEEPDVLALFDDTFSSEQTCKQRFSTNKRSSREFRDMFIKGFNDAKMCDKDFEGLIIKFSCMFDVSVNQAPANDILITSCQAISPNFKNINNKRLEKLKLDARELLESMNALGLNKKQLDLM